MAEPVLTARDVAIRIAARTLVAPLSFTIHAGERWALLGRNGAGKTLLLTALGGLTPLATGQVRIGDLDLARLRHGLTAPAAPWRQLARRRAFCPQTHGDAFEMRASDVIREALPEGLDAAHGAALTQSVLRHLTRFDVQSLAQTDVRVLSGGERKAVALAAALAQEAPLLMLDEPCAHLDVAHALEVTHTLTHLPHTQLASWHDLTLARRWATHAIILMPDGSACVERADAAMIPATLERAFGCRIEADHDRVDGWTYRFKRTAGVFENRTYR